MSISDSKTVIWDMDGVIADTNTHPRASLVEADLIVSSLKEITENDLRMLLSQS